MAEPRQIKPRTNAEAFAIPRAALFADLSPA
jgi:hypothetical protein